MERDYPHLEWQRVAAIHRDLLRWTLAYHPTLPAAHDYPPVLEEVQHRTFLPMATRDRWRDRLLRRLRLLLQLSQRLPLPRHERILRRSSGVSAIRHDQ